MFWPSDQTLTKVHLIIQTRVLYICTMIKSLVRVKVEILVAALQVAVSDHDLVLVHVWEARLAKQKAIPTYSVTGRHHMACYLCTLRHCVEKTRYGCCLAFQRQALDEYEPIPERVLILRPFHQRLPKLSFYNQHRWYSSI